jgi:glucose/arabinose dehydrogenase
MRLIKPIWNIFLSVSLGIAFATASQAAPQLPANYSLATVLERLNFPTQVAWLPDGTMLVLEKRGVLKAFSNGSMHIAADLSDSTNDYWDRGMLGLAVDIDFANNRLVYLNRVFENNSTKYAGTKTSQLVRIQLDGNNQIVPGSMLVLLGTATPRSCQELAATDDCIPADSSTHSVGDVLAAPDGTLYVSNGDGSDFAFNDPVSMRAQQLDSLAGKVLRVDRNGRGLPGNPYFTGNANDNRSKVFAYGLRNPWRLARNGQTGSVVIADVGSDYFEEINIGVAGANYGWPCYEGQRRRELYAFRDICDPLYDQVAQGRASVKAPLTGWLHNGDGAAIIGGTFITGPSYPASLRGTYIYGDYVSQYVRTLRTDGSDKLVAAPANFASGMTGAVAMSQGPDGKLYIVQIADASNGPDTGKLLRLDYQAPVQGGDCGPGQFKAEYFNGKELAGAPVLTQCDGAFLNHQWGLGSPGVGVGADNFSARWTGSFYFDAGRHRFLASADDGVRILVDGAVVLSGWQDQGYTAYQGMATLAAGMHQVTVEYYDQGAIAALAVNWAKDDGSNALPVVAIARPLGHLLVPVGGTVLLDGSAVDAEDGPISSAALQWNIVIQHCGNNACHSHFLQQIRGATGSFVFPDHGNDHYYLEVTLIATDSAGAQGSKTYRLDPNRAASDCGVTLFTGTYFNNKTMSGPPIAHHCSFNVDFSWPTGAPAPGITTDNFSARYTRTLPLEAGNYVFTVTGDDGVRFYVDGELLIDSWHDQAATDHTAARTLTAGDHSLRLEFYEATEQALIRLNWTK